jgi:hypothetical protein
LLFQFGDKNFIIYHLRCFSGDCVFHDAISKTNNFVMIGPEIRPFSFLFYGRMSHMVKYSKLYGGAPAVLDGDIVVNDWS